MLIKVEYLIEVPNLGDKTQLNDALKFYFNPGKSINIKNPYLHKIKNNPIPNTFKFKIINKK